MIKKKSITWYPIGILGGFILIVVIYMFIYSNSSYLSKNVELTLHANSNTTSNSIYVEVSGAVLNPGVYELPQNSRVFHLLASAGGITASASSSYILQDLNSVKILDDGEKVYIPFQGNSNLAISATDILSDDKDLIVVKETNVNDMTFEELLALSGIGEVYARKILSLKPFKSFDDLVERTKIPQKTLEGLKNELGL